MEEEDRLKGGLGRGLPFFFSFKGFLTGWSGLLRKLVNILFGLFGIKSSYFGEGVSPNFFGFFLKQIRDFLALYLMGVVEFILLFQQGASF